MTPPALLRLEAVLQWRYGTVAALAALAAAWTGVLALLPAAAARIVAPWVLLLDTAVAGATLVGTMVVLEREQGMQAALAATPAGPGGRVAARVGVLLGVTVAAAVPVALAGRPVSPAGLALALLGVGLVAAITALAGVAVAARRGSVIAFLIALPLILLPLMLPAAAHLAGLTHPGLYAIPLTGAVDLLRSGYGDPLVEAPAAWPLAPLLAVVGAFVLARGRLARPRRPAPRWVARLGRVPLPRPRPRVSGGPVRALLRTDLVTLRRDPLLLMIAASPALLGLVLRFGYPSARNWLAATHGFDLAAYRPLLLAVAVLLHVPVSFGMVGALLVLDDVDSRMLVAVRTSPLTLPRYLGYRAAQVTAAAWGGLAVALPASGLAGAAAWAVLPLAGLVAPLVLLGALAIARNKVAGVTALKLLGLPCYAPAAAWWLPEPAGWLFAPSPTWWIMQALWRESGLIALAGAAVSAAALALLARRALTRLAAG